VPFSHCNSYESPTRHAVRPHARLKVRFVRNSSAHSLHSSRSPIAYNHRAYHIRTQIFARARERVQHHHSRHQNSAKGGAAVAPTAMVELTTRGPPSAMATRQIRGGAQPAASVHNISRGHRGSATQVSALVSDAFHGGGRRGLAGHVMHTSDHLPSKGVGAQGVGGESGGGGLARVHGCGVQGKFERCMRDKFNIDLDDMPAIDREPVPLPWWIAAFHMAVVLVAAVIAIRDIYGATDCGQSRQESIAAGATREAFTHTDSVEQPSSSVSVSSSFNASPSSLLTHSKRQNYVAIECLGRTYSILWRRWSSPPNECGCRGMVRTRMRGGEQTSELTWDTPHNHTPHAYHPPR
jgi:hypothetical protein